MAVFNESLYLFIHSFIHLNVDADASVPIFKHICTCRVWIQLSWVPVSPAAGNGQMILEATSLKPVACTESYAHNKNTHSVDHAVTQAYLSPYPSIFQFLFLPKLFRPTAFPVTAFSPEHPIVSLVESPNALFSAFHNVFNTPKAPLSL